MIGPTQESKPRLFHYGVNLEKRVRSNNPLRAVKAAVDFGFVRKRVAGFYGKDGHESEDPIVIMKLMLLLFMDNVSSERELMRIVGGLLSTKLCLAAESESSFKARLEHRVQLRQNVSDAVGSNSPFAVLE